MKFHGITVIIQGFSVEIKRNLPFCIQKTKSSPQKRRFLWGKQRRKCCNVICRGGAVTRPQILYRKICSPQGENTDYFPAGNPKIYDFRRAGRCPAPTVRSKTFKIKAPPNRPVRCSPRSRCPTGCAGGRRGARRWDRRDRGSGPSHSRPPECRPDPEP